MKVLNVRVVKSFIRREPRSVTSLNFWLKAVRGSSWKNPADILATFNDTDGIGGNKFIFNIGGNRYRLAAMVWFAAQIVYVLKVMSHKEYDKEDWQ